MLLFDRRWPFLFLQFSREILSVSEKRGLFCPPKIMLQLKLHTATTSTTTKELKTATAHAHEAQHEESHQKVAFCCALLFFFHCNSDENSPAICETMNDARVAGLLCAQKSSIFSSSRVFFAEKISSTGEESKNLRNSENSIRVTIPCQFMELEMIAPSTHRTSTSIHVRVSTFRCSVPLLSYISSVTGSEAAAKFITSICSGVIFITAEKMRKKKK